MSKLLISKSLFFLIFSSGLGFIIAPFLIKFLEKFNIRRQGEYDSTFVRIDSRKKKIGTPVMGGILVVFVVGIVTVLFNWDRRFTWVPIGVMVLSSVLGGIDDLMNIFGKFRNVRKASHVIRLSKVHKFWYMRVWYKIQIPWAYVRSFFNKLGSRTGKGVLVHEKLFLQFVAGSITAWWLYFKLGPQWKLVWVPFNGELNIGWMLIPVVIFLVMATANAVNVADGLDGLTGGTLITAFGGLLVMSWFEGSVYFSILNASVVGALVPYTFFNIKPARFQMGDVGSLGLGALLAVMAIAQNKMFILPLLGFIFFLELASVVIQLFSKNILGKKVFAMTPLHHHLEIKGWLEESIVQKFWIINLLAVLLAVWLSLH